MATPGQFIEQAMLSGFEQGQAQRQSKKADARQEKIKLRDQLATKISSLEEGTPEHKQAKDLLVQVDTDLMDPNHPMPIEKIKNLLTGHFGHKQPAQPAPSVTTQVGGVSTPDISSGPSIPSAEHLLSVPALGQTASTPTPITIPEPPTEAPAAPTEAAQPPARNYASPDNTSGVVDPKQFRPSTPMLRRAFPAKSGFHLVTNPMEGQKAYYQSDSDPSDIREAKTGLKKKVSVEDASATTPASQKAATSDGSTPSASQLPKQPKDAINQFSNPEEQPREVSFAFNKGWAKHGPYATNLPADEEAEFRQWAAANPDSIRGEVGSGPDFKPIVDADYDVRGHFHAAKIGDPAASLTPNPWDGKIHGNDKFKTPYNGGFSRESMYALSTAPGWTKEGKLLTQDGRLVTDETPRTEDSSTAQGQPAAPAATTDTGQLPALPTPAVSIPGHDLTVKGPAQPKLSPRQQKAQSQAEQQAQLEIAAAGLTPEEKGIAQARADAAGNLFAFQANSKLYEMMNPRPTDPAEIPEWEKGKRAYQNELLQGMMGIKNKRNIKMFTVPGSTTPIPLDQNDPESWPEGAVPYKEPTIASIEIEEFRQAQNAGYTGTIMQYKADSVKSKAIQAEWTRAHYGGRDMDQLSPKEADQAMARFKEESTPDTTSNGQTLVFDQNNQPHVFTHTTTSHKSFSGAGGGLSAQPSPPSVTTSPNGAAAPNTLAGVKGKAAKLNPPTSSAPRTPKSPIGPALDFKKMTPDITAAIKLYNDAVGLVEYADKVQKHPDNAQEQRDFAIKMERVMSGRFQTAAYDLEVKNSGIANTFQQWVNDIKTGALPQQIVDHLVESAHDYKDSMAAEVAAAKGTSPDSSGGSSTPNSGDKSLADRLHQAYGAK